MTPGSRPPGSADPSRPRRALFWLLLAIFPGIPFLLALVTVVSRLVDLALPAVAETVLLRLPEERRERLYERLAESGDLFGPRLIESTMRRLPEDELEALYDRMAVRVGSWADTLPEAGVARIAKRHHRYEFRGAEVVTNNAGLRSDREFRAKEPGVYRIVCLGDSMVFGAGGPPEDRFCDQIERFFDDAGLAVDGKTVETYALGIGSWTMVNEATYLGSRISAYDPDLILVLTLANDVTDGEGVTGAGITTRQFSPERRELGTAVFTIWQSSYFGTHATSALTTDLAPESRRRWDKGMRLMKRLEDLQLARGGRILFSVLEQDAYFSAIYEDYYRRLGFRSPLLETSYFTPDGSTSLAHDPHPNRAGHAVLASHYLHAMARAGIVSIPAERLPELRSDLDAEGAVPADDGELAKQRRRYVQKYLKTRLEFDALESDDVKAYLGGFFPERQEGALGRPPFASVKSAFLLRRPAGGGGDFELEIEVPPFSELYPFELAVSLDGTPVETLRLERPADAGRHVVRTALPALGPEVLAVEVLLETSSYWTTIDDPRMKSFYLLSAAIE